MMDGSKDCSVREFVLHKCFLKGFGSAWSPPVSLRFPRRTAVKPGSPRILRSSPSGARRRRLQPVTTNVSDNFTLVLYARR